MGAQLVSREWMCFKLQPHEEDHVTGAWDTDYWRDRPLSILFRVGLVCWSQSGEAEERYDSSVSGQASPGQGYGGASGLSRGPAHPETHSAWGPCGWCQGAVTLSGPSTLSAGQCWELDMKAANLVESEPS